MPALALLAALAALQQPPDVVFRTETNLAMVKFHVIQKGRYVEDLRADDIQLLEDGKPQKIALFEGPGQPGRRSIPVEIILLFDVSLSVMNANLLDSYAIRDTVLTGLDGTVGVSVYAFGARFKKFTAPTKSIKRLKEAMDSAYRFTNPGTPLYESIRKAAEDAWATGGPNVARVMLIFSDGEATTKEKPTNAVKTANQYGVTLYPVVLGHRRAQQRVHAAPGPAVPGAGPANPQQQARADRLRDQEAQMAEFASIAEPTGGRSFDPPMINNMSMKQILAAVASGVRTEYVTGFYPAAVVPKQPHKLEVKLLNKSKGRLSGGQTTVVH